MLNGMKLDIMPQGVDPVTQTKVRRRMLTWYVNMGHQTQFDDEASFRSFGDVKLANKPKLRDYLKETTSVIALVRGGKQHGTA